MLYFIDRRQNPKGKGVGNRQRLFRRARRVIRQVVGTAVEELSIKEIAGGEGIKVPVKDLSEPTWRHASTGGKRDAIYPGNKEFKVGDKISKPKEDEGGRGREGSAGGHGEDVFEFVLSRDEFLNIFFEGLELLLQGVNAP